MMKVAAILLLFTLSPASGKPFQLRRRMESAACSASELDDFSCALLSDEPGQNTGAYVCRQGFRACIHPDDHEDTDECDSCPQVVVSAPEPKENTVPADLPPTRLCFLVDRDDYSCTLTDGSGNEGTMTCHLGTSVCVPTSEVGSFNTCGCCKGDLCKLSPESAEPADAIETKQSSSCTAEQLDKFACAIANDGPGETSGAYVCRHGFTACLSPEDHKAGDECGMCPAVERVPVVKENPTATGPTPPMCSEVNLDDYPCSLGDGSGMQGTEVCTGAFSACVPSELAAIMPHTHCGCCVGDKSPRCV